MNYSNIKYDDYAKVFSIYRNASSRVITHVIKSLENKRVNRMLEVGCGTADYLYALSKKLNSEAYGFDKSVRMVKEGNIKNPGLRISVSDALNLFPFEDSCFDLAFSINVIHYITEISHYLREMYRVLGTNGIALTITPSSRHMKKSLSKYFPEFDENSIISNQFIPDFEDAMAKIGFKNIRVTNTDFTYKMTQHQLEPIINKAYAWTRLLSKDCLEAGIGLMKADIQKGICEENEFYAYIWGEK